VVQEKPTVPVPAPAPALHHRELVRHADSQVFPCAGHLVQFKQRPRELLSGPV
jgi:hypothetical protein